MVTLMRGPFVILLGREGVGDVGAGVAALTSLLRPLTNQSPVLPRGNSNSYALNSCCARYSVYIF